MSIVLDRVIRMLNYDRYLPMRCFANARQQSFKYGVCNCFIECKFTPKNYHELKQNQDYQNSELEKDRV